MFYFALLHVHLQFGPLQVSSRYCGVHCLVVRISCSWPEVQDASQVCAQCPSDVCPLPSQHFQHAGPAEAGPVPAAANSKAAETRILNIVAFV
jgi:hypothetical protein